MAKKKAKARPKKTYTVAKEVPLMRTKGLSGPLMAPTSRGKRIHTTGGTKKP